MTRGYMGKILNVDLSRRELKDEVLDEKLCRDYIGGYGIGVRILYDRMKAGVDPLGPDSILGIMSSPLTGTDAISGTRFTVVGKSPLTGCWGDANSGGYFGAYIKFSGYDGIFFTGISAKPVYLFIDNGKAELKDAAHLWGKDTYETEDILKSELGKDVAIVSIGPSGEKLARLSCIMHNKGSAAGRAGLGAIMGSKKLKAVAVKGKMAVQVADAKGLKKLRTKILAKMSGDIDWLGKFGTSFVTVQSAESGDSPVKNWGGVAANDFPDARPLGADPLDEYKQKRTGCYRCPISCEAIMKEGTGEYKYEAGSFRPEYETLAMFGSNCLNNNLESIIKANDICNRYGIDTISAGAVMAFAMECYEKGLITKKDTGGIEMTWGNHKSLVAMMEKIARREGLGDILADGVKIAAKKIGKGAEKYAIHIQGQEVPAHSPMAGFHWPATYIANATPGRHTQGSEGFSQELMPEYDRGSFSGRGQAHKTGTCHQHALMCCGMCLFVMGALPSNHVMTEFIKAVTGWDITTDELLVTGERIENVRQAFNIREGLNLLQYEIPGRILGKPPHKEGPLAGITVDADTLVKEYLAAMDWDLETARPSEKKLKELGLDDVAQELWPR
ncbi:MAG: aldehyde ferredoxin oxidoreductase family protein [Dehalococcoidales bacterium]|nr:aldehyde ferredoxin oxidoreductase family protein [Dehalococcoidales bacterium]